MKHFYALPNVTCPKCGSNTFVRDTQKEPMLDFKKPCDPLMLMLNGVTEFVKRHYMKCSDCDEPVTDPYQVPEQTVTYTFYPKTKIPKP